MNEIAQTIIEGAEIASVPHILQEILTKANDPSSSSRSLEEIIHKEPGLAAHLLKTANSAYYSTSREISSLKHSIVMLGFLTVFSSHSPKCRSAYPFSILPSKV